jgi:hypothetical protein
MGSVAEARSEQDVVDDMLDVIASPNGLGALLFYADAAVVIGENGDYASMTADNASMEKLKKAAKESKMLTRAFKESFSATVPGTCYSGCEELDKADDPSTPTIGCSAYACTLSKMAKAKYTFHLLANKKASK